jgi:ketosteroid isomerase-like protein
MEEAPELAELMEAMYEAISRGDATFFEETISSGDATVAIGTDPGEWWDDHRTAKDAWRSQLPGLAEMELESTKLAAYASGDVGFAVDEVNGRMPDGTEFTFRITGVFERENGEWKIVHSHGSVGVPNEEAVGRELPGAS